MPKKFFYGALIAAVVTLNVWGATTLRSLRLTASTIDNTAITASTISGTAITGGTIDGTPIGLTTPSTAALSSLNLGATGTTPAGSLFLVTAASTTYSAIASNGCQEQTVIIIGVTANGVAFVSPVSGYATNLSWSARTGINAVVIRVCNVTTAIFNPGAVTWNVAVLQP